MSKRPLEGDTHPTATEAVKARKDIEKVMGEFIHEEMVKHLEPDPSSMLPVTDVALEPVKPEDFTGLPKTYVGVDMAINYKDYTALHPHPLLTFLDAAIKRRAYGEFIPLPLFHAIMEMVNTLPNTKIDHEHYPDTYSIAAALDKLSVLNPYSKD